MNTNSSSLGNPGSVGFGGILRDHNGAWVSAFTGSCEITTSLKAELFAIMHGLQTAWDSGLRDIICESDSAVALELINKEPNVCHPYYAIIKKIQDTITLPWKCSLQHTWREANSCADWLAKYGSSHDDPYVLWSTCPTQLANPMLADAMGITHLRP